MSSVPLTLDPFFTSKPIPYTKKLKKITFTNIEGTPFQGYIFEGKKCLTPKQLTKHIPNGKYKTVLAAFHRAKIDFNMQLGIDYNEIDVKKILTPNPKTRGSNILLYRSSVLLTLAKMSKKFNSALLYRLIHYYFDSEDKKQSYLNYQPKEVYLLPRMGNKHITKNMDLVDSRGEQIIADILYDFGIPYQIGVYFRKYGFNCDFIIKTEPLTIIEYWGMETDDYKEGRKWKEGRYGELGWNLFSIEPSEVENIPKLRGRISRYFKIKGGN